MLADILAIISTLIMITLLKRLVNIFPSLIACMVRWKESVNLEASVKNSLDRDMLAAACIIPFCIVVEKFRLYDPSFVDGMSENIRLLIIIGVFLAYCSIRIMMSAIVKTHKATGKSAKTAERSSFTFFIILSLILILTGWGLSFLKVDTTVIRSAMLWISGIIYALSLLRKTQIFVSGCSFFTAFLYLCALEIFPTGALVASALIL
ncbi:MAG: DUF4271 domain-containing protein [Bacteroidales bacterium]|nr:DUF4271 domain-containing protein [Bacteroidales bacterium]